VSTPVAVAPIINQGDDRSPTMKKPITIPNSTVWLMASLTIAVRRKTRKTPGSAQAAATSAASS
jgi:hypothetical protein